MHTPEEFPSKVPGETNENYYIRMIAYVTNAANRGLSKNQNGYLITLGLVLIGVGLLLRILGGVKVIADYFKVDVFSSGDFIVVFLSGMALVFTGIWMNYLLVRQGSKVVEQASDAVMRVIEASTGGIRGIEASQAPGLQPNVVAKEPSLSPQTFQ